MRNALAVCCFANIYHNGQFWSIDTASSPCDWFFGTRFRCLIVGSRAYKTRPDMQVEFPQHLTGSCSPHNFSALSVSLTTQPSPTHQKAL